MEDEKNFLDYPYYEMTYFDDDNIVHFTQVKDVYQKFGMSNLYFEHVFHFFNNNSKKIL